MKFNRLNVTPRRPRTFRSWLRCMAAMGGVACADPAAAFSIRPAGTDPAGRLKLQLEGAADTYVVLYRGGSVDTLRDPIVVQASPEGTITLVDPLIPTGGESRFYRVRRYSTATPGDADGDGIDDWQELRYASVLNPLNPADAALDSDHDGRSNLEEARAGTDPTVADLLLTRVEASPAPGLSGVSVTREVIWRFSQPLAGNTQLTGENLYAEFGGRRLLTRNHLGLDRRSATLFFLEPVPAGARIRVRLDGNSLRDEAGRLVDADGDGQPGGWADLRYDTMNTTPLPGAGVSGYVYDSQAQSTPNGPRNQPLAGVIVTVDGNEQGGRAVTDANGHFVLSPCPVGRFFVHIDGRPAVGSSWPNGSYYPFVGKTFEATPGHTNTEPGGGPAIYLPKVPAGALKAVSALATTTVEFPQSVLTARPELAGVRITVPPNALFADDGTRGGRVGIAPVPSDRLPSPLPPGLEPPIVITVQTDGPSNFDQPVGVRFPNLPDLRTGLRRGPGEKTVLWSFNHDSGKWEPQGTMTISADGNFAVSDPGVGIRQPGWHAASAVGQPKPPPPLCSQAQQLKLAKEYFDAQLKELECMVRLAAMLGGVPSSIQGPAQTLSALAQVGSTLPGIIAGLQGIAAGVQNGQNAAALGATFSVLSGLKTAGAVVVIEVSGKTPAASVLDLTTCILKMAKEQLDFLCLGATCFFPPSTPNFATQQAYCNGMRTTLTGLLNAISAYKFAGANSMKRFCTAMDKLGPLLASLSAPPKPVPNGRNAAPAQTPEERRAEVLAALEEAIAAAQEVQADLQPSVTLIAEMEKTRAAYADMAANVEGPVLFQSNAHLDSYYVLTSAGVSVRGRTTALGTFDLPLISLTDPYYFAIYDPVRNTVSEIHAPAPGFGAQAIIPDLALRVPGINDLSGDADGDGLTDLAESVLGTRPDSVDSDGDGTNDLTEVQQGRNPLDGLLYPPGPVAALALPGVAKGITIDGTTAILATGVSGLAVVDLSDPLKPVTISQTELPGDSYDVAYSARTRTAGVVAYASNEQIARGELSQIHFVDLADPVKPRLLRTLVLPAKLIEHRDGLFFVAVGAEVRIYEAASGLELGSLKLEDLVSGLLATESELFVTTAGSLSILRRQGLDTQRIGRLDGDFAAADIVSSVPLVQEGDRLWVGTARGMYTVDISDRSQPKLLNQPGSILRAFRTLALTGGRQAVALTVVGANAVNLGGQTTIYNISDVRSTNILGSILNGRSRTYDAALTSGWVVLADGLAGLTVMNVLPPDTSTQLPVVEWSLDSADVDPARPGVQLIEGATVVFRPQITDDVGVARVELLVNGEVVDTQRTVPAVLETRLPLRRDVGNSLRLALRCRDRGGHVVETEPIEIELLADTAPPVVLYPRPGSAVASFLDAPLVLRLNESMVDGDLLIAGVSLVNLGANGIVGGGDDVVVPVTAARAMGATALIWPAAVLPPGRYQLQLTRNFMPDAAGNGLAADLALDVLPIAANSGVAVWTSPNPGRFNDPDNWLARRVPGQEDVVLSLPGGTPLVTVDGIANLRSLVAAGSLTVSQSGTLSVRDAGVVQGTINVNGGFLNLGGHGHLVTGLEQTGGTVLISGRLETRGTPTLRAGANAILDGPDAAWIRVAGLDSRESSLQVRNGAVAEFGEFTVVESNGDFSDFFPLAASFRVQGAGSRLRLPNLISARGPVDSSFTGAPSLEFTATDGGVMEVPVLADLSRRVRLVSEGIDSRVDAPLLARVEGPVQDPFPALIRSAEAGRINAPQLAVTKACQVQLANLGVLACQSLGIDAGLSLRGDGTVIGNVVCAGTLLVDQPGGVLRIEGGLTLTASAIYRPTIGSVFGTGSLQVTQAVQLAGTLQPDAARAVSIPAGETYEVGNFSGPVTGAFKLTSGVGISPTASVEYQITAGHLAVHVLQP